MKRSSSAILAVFGMIALSACGMDNPRYMSSASGSYSSSKNNFQNSNNNNNPVAATASTLSVAANGTLQINASGGVAPYLYEVVTGFGTVDSNGLFHAPSYAETDTIRVTDNAGSVASVNITVTASVPISAYASQTSIIAGASVVIFASGGSGNYTYSLINGYGSMSGASYLSNSSDAGTTVQIQVSDSSGNTVIVSVSVSGVAQTTGTWQVSGSGCGPMQPWGVSTPCMGYVGMMCTTIGQKCYVQVSQYQANYGCTNPFNGYTTTGAYLFQIYTCQ